MRLPAILAIAALALAPAAHAQKPPARSLDAFEAALAEQDSATAALTQWCELHDIADAAQITARPAADAMKLPSEGEGTIRGLLQVKSDEKLGYRHVLLSCGDVVLSDAHNWYVPSRLTEAANYLLEGTDTPFGRAVGAENFIRVRISEQQGAAEKCPPDTVLSHAAVLLRLDGLPLSLVLECYTPANLADAAHTPKDQPAEP